MGGVVLACSASAGSRPSGSFGRWVGNFGDKILSYALYIGQNSAPEMTGSV